MPKKTARKTTRKLVLSDDKSNKYWNIKLSGSSYTIDFRRVGSLGQTQIKAFQSKVQAEEAFDDMVESKLKKGYVDAGAKKKATKKKAAKKKSSKKKTSAKPTSNETAKILVLKAVHTHNFWKIDLEGNSHTISYGAVGKVGRSQTAEFPDAEAARASFDKLVAAKLKRGYKDAPESILVTEPPPEEVESEETPTDFDLSVAHEIDLDPVDWYVASYRKLPPLDRPVVKAKKKVDRAVLEKRLYGLNSKHTASAAQQLSSILSLDEFIDLLMKRRKSNHHEAFVVHLLVDTFSQHIVPYLSSDELQTIRNRIRDEWDPTKEPDNPQSSLPPEFYLAACVGLHEEVYQVTSRWEDNRYKSAWFCDFQYPQRLVFGLASPELIISEWRRLGLRFYTETDVKYFLACTETACLEEIAATVLSRQNKQDTIPFAEALALVRTPDAVPFILKCKLDSRTPGIFREWMDKNVGTSISGLIDIAAERGVLGTAAIEYLRNLKRRGFEDTISQIVEASGNSSGRTRIEQEVLAVQEQTFEPFDAALAQQRTQSTGWFENLKVAFMGSAVNITCDNDRATTIE